MENRIILQKVISTNIDSVGYDDARNLMLVRFKTGVLYEYKNVTHDAYTSLLSAQSIGKYFTSNIKGKYPYRKVKLNDEQ